MEAVAPASDCYEAEVTCHCDGVEETARAGFFPQSAKEKQTMGQELVEWLAESSEGCEFFLLLCTHSLKDTGQPQVKFRFGHEAV